MYMYNNESSAGKPASSRGRTSDELVYGSLLLRRHQMNFHSEGAETR